MLQKSFFEMGARMGDDSSQIVRALISNVEYRFVEKLSSATDGSEVVYARRPTVKGDTRLARRGRPGTRGSRRVNRRTMAS